MFFEIIILIKKWINCWLIQLSSQLWIKRAFWELHSPKHSRCHAHIKAYLIRLWNTEVLCDNMVPLGVCVVGASCKWASDTRVCSRRLISGTCWGILQGEWCNVKLRYCRWTASHILFILALQKFVCKWDILSTWAEQKERLSISFSGVTTSLNTDEMHCSKKRIIMYINLHGSTSGHDCDCFPCFGDTYMLKWLTASEKCKNEGWKQVKLLINILSSVLCAGCWSISKHREQKPLGFHQITMPAPATALCCMGIESWIFFYRQ